MTLTNIAPKTIAMLIAFTPSIALAQSAPAQKRSPTPPAPPSLAAPAPALPRQKQKQKEQKDSKQRGWLGVSLQESDQGLAVGTVVDGSPAEHAGLRGGDRIVSIDGESVDSYSSLVERLGRSHPGASVDVQVRREVSVALDDDHKSGNRFVLGVFLGGAQNVGDYEGVAVESVNDGWPAARAGIGHGDVLLEVNGKHVASSQHVIQALEGLDASNEVKVELARKVHVTLGSPPQGMVEMEPGQFGHALPPIAPPADVAPVAPADPYGRPQPPPTSPHARASRSPESDELLNEVRSLQQELRELREQIAQLRDQLDQMPRRR